jgi:hypothetical protein
MPLWRGTPAPERGPVTEEKPIQCSPCGVQLAESIRTLADMIEAGEVVGVALCATFSDREPSDETMGSVIWTDPAVQGWFRLVGATAVLHARVLHKFHIPEALHHYHEGDYTLGQPLPPEDPEDQ